MAAVLTSNTLPSDENINTDRYALPRNESERERLELQHTFLTEVLGGRLVIDKNVKLGAGNRVLDSGTGAVSWLLALSKEVPETVELVGTDISPAMFPKEVPKNVKLYEESTTSLPTEWDNSFDLISQRLLLAAFTAPQWSTALSEMNRVLKPGGAIQLIEVGRYSCPQGSVSLPATDKALHMIAAFMDTRGLLGLECGKRLPGMLEVAGFRDVRLELCHAPLGKQWGDIGMRCSRAFQGVIRSFGVSLMLMGGLGICSSQSEVDEIVDRAKEEWDDNPGLFNDLYVISARKASE